jgi:hypothetical protein
MLLHDRLQPTSALASDMVKRVETTAWQRLAISVLEALAFDTSAFEIGVHIICGTAEFGVGSVLVTVSARRERVSRTYVCNSPGSGWPCEFEKDLRAGLFGARRSVEADASLLRKATHPTAAARTPSEERLNRASEDC